MTPFHGLGGLLPKHQPNQPVVGCGLRRTTELRSLHPNNTRQGYVRKDTLKLAGFLFLERAS